MKIKNLKINWPSKKVALKLASGTIATFMIFSSFAPTAEAHVPTEYIIGEQQTGYDYTAVKVYSGQALSNYFNNLCEKKVTLEEIRKSVVLSNLLNGYYPGPNEYSNTNLNEIISLDINKLYDDYIRSIWRNRETQFCNDNLTNMAALDAYTLFAGHTASTELKNALAIRLIGILTDEGYQVEEIPNVIISENRIYAVTRTNRGLIKINLTGDLINIISNEIVSLEGSYNTAMANLTGASNEYENSFAYQGPDTRTGSSVYLSIADSNRKEDLLYILDTINRLNTGEDITLSQTGAYSRLTTTARRELEALGYTSSETRNAKETRVLVTLPPVLRYEP